MKNIPDSLGAPGYESEIPNLLPHNEIYSIHIGQEVFRLSGASLSSDGPSYFTAFFSDKNNSNEVLFVDRSAKIFHYITMHLQGYYIAPQSDIEYAQLFSDAMYYHLPRLVTHLTSTVSMISIGSKVFKIPREIFNSPGNSPNFFTLGFSNFFSAHVEFPSKDVDIVRPPPIAPATVLTRSGELFEILLEMLRGAKVNIKDENQRRLLLEECQFYRFKGLEQRIIKHNISVNNVTGREEITLSINNISLDHISIVDDIVTYRRPYVDEHPRDLVIQFEGGIIEHEIVGHFFRPQSKELRSLVHLADKIFPSRESLSAFPVFLKNSYFEVDGRQISTLENDSRPTKILHLEPRKYFLSKSLWALDPKQKNGLKLLKAIAFEDLVNFNAGRSFM